jgi:hypothetical protein
VVWRPIVYILPDNDKPGRDHARKVAEKPPRHRQRDPRRGSARTTRQGATCPTGSRPAATKRSCSGCARRRRCGRRTSGKAEGEPLEWADDIQPVLYVPLPHQGPARHRSHVPRLRPAGSGQDVLRYGSGVSPRRGSSVRGRRVRQCSGPIPGRGRRNRAANRIAALRATYSFSGLPFALRRARLNLMRDGADLKTVCTLASKSRNRCPACPSSSSWTPYRAPWRRDENAAADMTALIRNLDAIRDETGAHVLAVHHAGGQRQGRSRAQLLKGATDTEIEMRTRASFGSPRSPAARHTPARRSSPSLSSRCRWGSMRTARPVSSCVVVASDECRAAQAPPQWSAAHRYAGARPMRWPITGGSSRARRSRPTVQLRDPRALA